jgi:hypothetical protein
MIFYTSKYGYTTDPFSIEEVLFLENNYWDENKKQIKTDEGYLVYVEVFITEIKNKYQWKKLYPMHSFYDRGKNKYLSFLCSHDVESIISASKSHDDKHFAVFFYYCFTVFELNVPIDFKCLARLRSFVKYNENYKNINNQIGDIIKFEEFGPDSYLIYVKEKLLLFFCGKYLVLENFESVLDDNFENQHHEFKFYYFDSISSCLENYKAFVRFVNILKCSREDSDTIDSDKNVFQISYLDKYFREKIKHDFKNKVDTVLLTQFINEQVDLLYQRCFDEIIDDLSTNDLFLPVRDSFTKEFYFDQFYKLIKKIIENMLEDVIKYYKDYIPGHNDSHFRRFKRDLYEFGSTIIDKYWESWKIIDYFTGLIGKEIKTVDDFIEVDKILCDFSNVMRFLEGLKKDQICDDPKWYDKLMFIDNFHCQLVRGIEVSLENPVQFGGIKAFDSTGKKIKMERNFDYFVRVYMNKCKVSLTFERIRERDIQEIEVISADKKYRQWFNVAEYLD